MRRPDVKAAQCRVFISLMRANTVTREIILSPKNLLPFI